MRLLISNDDGIQSRGIELLAKAAKRFGEVVVVAPAMENSSASHSISSSRPLSYHRADFADDIEAYRVNGTPADCVALGMFHSDIDVVLSGVNSGTNLGNAIWHSGTMAAARQGALLGARGIALSTPTTEDDKRIAGLEDYVAQILESLLPRDDLRLVNVNIPLEPKGVYWVRQAMEKYDGQVVPANDPYGRPIYWLTVTQIKEHSDGTDLWAFERGYITITPLTLDVTATQVLSEMPLSQKLVEFPTPEKAPDLAAEGRAAESQQGSKEEAHPDAAGSQANRP